MMRDVPPETVVDGRYKIESRIGSGGMADVYCAQDLQLGRKVALKLLYRRFAEDSEFVERFRREAQSAAGLQHPNVVGVYDRGEWDGTYYIAMEYLEGRSLKQIVHDEAPLDPNRAIDVAIQILKASRFAHKRGVIHRDLKPHNVILDEEDRLKVTDFGIARAGASDMTETGSIMGTAQYLSPEQAQGHAVSAASDLYSIGIVLYEMLTGRVPFEGETAVTIALKQVGEEPAPPSSLNPAIPPALEAVVMHALHKDPANRFADAAEFIEALERAREGVAAVPAGQSTSAFAAAGAPTDPTRLAPAGPVVVEPAEAFVYPDEPLPPAVKREWGRWPWILLGLLLVAALAFGAYQLTRAEQVRVPDVVGKDSNTAATILENKGFDVSPLNVTDNAEKGKVLRTNPQPGTDADKGSTVTITVSQGPGLATIPTVVNKGRKAAHKELVAAGFKVFEREEPNEAVAKNHVIGTQPLEGNQLEKGMTVTLLVSSGLEQVKVPDVTGDSRSDAEDELKRAGFEVEVVRKEDKDKDPGTVLSQNPAGGTDADKGAVVTLTVAKAPAEETVPDVVGSSQDEATAALEDAGFKVKVSEQNVDTPDEDGVVLSQSPGGDSKARPDSTVTITVGRFVEATPPEDTATTP